VLYVAGKKETDEDDLENDDEMDKEDWEEEKWGDGDD
jgi:hypothetical protein